MFLLAAALLTSTLEAWTVPNAGNGSTPASRLTIQYVPLQMNDRRRLYLDRWSKPDAQQLHAHRIRGALSWAVSVQLVRMLHCYRKCLIRWQRERSLDRKPLPLR